MPTSVQEELAALRAQSLTTTQATKLHDAQGLSTPEKEEAQMKDLNEMTRLVNYSKEAKESLNAGTTAVGQDLEFKRQLSFQKKQQQAKQIQAKRILASPTSSIQSQNGKEKVKATSTNGNRMPTASSVVARGSSSPPPASAKLTDFGPHVPEDKIQYRIQTPYGEGLTLRTRKATKEAPQMRQIELVDWKRAPPQSTTTASATSSSSSSTTRRGIVQPAMLYSTQDFPSVPPQIDDEVTCTFGRGKVTEIRVSSTHEAAAVAPDGTSGSNTTTTTTIVVLLSSWRLANRSRVSCYMNPSQVRVVRSKRIYEMTVHERVEAALAFKEQAARDFGAKNYQAALQSYAKAIDAVRYVQHKQDSDNYVRADLLVVMVTTTNNAGTCARHLGRWEESGNFGKNAQVLLDAVQRKKGMKIHTILVQDGYHDVKLFGEWKVKSMLLQARALAEKQDFDQAIDMLKKTHEVIATYTTDEYAANEKYEASVKTLRNLEKEVKKLHAACKERKSLLLKKEKQRAAAMFGGSSPKANTANKKALENVQTTTPTPKEKENHVPNNGATTYGVSPSSERRSPTPVSTTLPLKDSSSESHLDEAPIENGNGRMAKRRVSFSEKVTAFEIPKKQEDDENDNVVEDELPWYKDQEVLLGLAIFGGAVVASSAMVNFLLRRRG